jgi:hypothetical protein
MSGQYSAAHSGTFQQDQLQQGGQLQPTPAQPEDPNQAGAAAGTTQPQQAQPQTPATPQASTSQTPATPSAQQPGEDSASQSVLSGEGSGNTASGGPQSPREVNNEPTPQ